jgi:hypothetical protein
MARSTRPRTRAGMSSSIAELMAAYSLPIPAPGKNRAMKEVPRREGESRCDRGREVDRQREHEELLASEAVGELTEK